VIFVRKSTRAGLIGEMLKLKKKANGHIDRRIFHAKTQNRKGRVQDFGSAFPLYFSAFA